MKMRAYLTESVRFAVFVVVILTGLFALNEAAVLASNTVQEKVMPLLKSQTTNIWFEDQTHYFEYFTIQELTQRKAVLDLFEVREGASKHLGRVEIQDGDILAPTRSDTPIDPYHDEWCFVVKRRSFDSEWCVSKDKENGNVQFLEQYN